MATPPDLGQVAPGEGPLDELLAALVQAGEVDSQGSFTLDRQKARQKMQRFQLAEPARYVLELIQAAVLRGARQIDVQIDQDDLHLRCDATPFTLQDFEQIYDALFIRSRVDKRQALRHLALGTSTALSLKPAWVRVESGGAAGAYLQLFPGDKEQMGKTTQADHGLHIHVRQRGRLGVLWRLLTYYKDPRPAEFEMLREHCGLSMVPIEINGMPITVGYQLPGTMFWMTYQHGSTRGVIGVLGDHNLLSDPGKLPPSYPFGLRSTMHLLRNCVSFEIDQPALLLPGFGTLVESPSFHLDISHQRVVRNESFEEAVRLVLAQQIQLLVRECRRLHSGERALFPPILEGLVLALLSRLGSLEPLLRWAGRSTTGPSLLPRGFPEQVPGAEALLVAWLWPTPLGQRISLGQILVDLQTFGTVAVTAVRSKGVDRERPVVLLLKDATSREVFANLFPGRLEERDVASQAAHERATNLARWRKLKQEPRLPLRAYLALVPIKTARVHGEIGLEGDSDAAVDAAEHARPRPGELRLTLLHQGGVLAVKHLAVPLPGLHAILTGEFTPTYAWDDVEPDEPLRAALRAVLEALPVLVEQLLTAPGHSQGLLREKRQRALRELVLMSRSPTAQGALTEQLGLPAPEPTLPPSAVPLERLAGVPLFEGLAGESLTLDQLREHFVKRGYVAILHAEVSGEGWEMRAQLGRLFRGGNSLTKAWQRASAACPGQAARVAGQAEFAPPWFVIWQGGSLGVLRDALGELVPPTRIWDIADWLAATAEHLQALTARERALPLPLTEQFLTTARLSSPAGPLGTLGLLAKSRWHRSEDLLEIALPMADAVQMALRYGLPGGGRLAVELLPSAELLALPSAGEPGVAARATLRRSVSQALLPLAANLLAHPDAHAARLCQDFLAALATAIFPTAVLRMNYERLRSQAARSGHPAADAETEHAAILELVAARSAQHIDAAIQRLLQQFPEEPVRAAAVYAELTAVAPPAAALTDDPDPLVHRPGAAQELLAILFPETTAPTFDLRALHPHPLLQKAPLFVALSGEPLTLGQVLAECAQHGDLLYVATASAAPPSAMGTPAESRRVVQVTQDATALFLFCLLGEQRLRVYQPGAAELALPASAPAASTRADAGVLSASAAPGKAAETAASALTPVQPPQESPAERARGPQEERLLKALATEIRAVVGSAHKLLSRINLERIHIGEHSEPLAVICTEYQTLLNRKNAAVKRALGEAEQDPAAMWFLILAIYTALNLFFEEVTDEDEAQFLVLLSRRAIGTLSRHKDVRAS